MLIPSLAPGIYCISSIDWDLREFHGYATERGSSYNAYLIIDQKVALIDTAKEYFGDSLLAKLKTLIDPAKIDYLISLHVEADHSGALPLMAKAIPNAKIITSAPAGKRGLSLHYGDLDYQTVKTGDILNLGARNLHFVQTTMVHWPDNMVAYMPEEGILFSSDAFGQHYASSFRFDDEAPQGRLMDQAAKYYANIVLPFGDHVKKALAVVKELNPKVLAPAHGIIWRDNPAKIIAKYEQWADNQVSEKAVIVFDTMWQSTAKMATAINEAFIAHDIETHYFNLQYNHISDIMAEVLEAKYIIIGSPTMHNRIMPSVAAFLEYIIGLAPKNRIGLAFGSYGWSGQSPGLVNAAIEGMGWQTLGDPQKICYIPTPDDLQALYQYVDQALANPK